MKQQEVMKLSNDELKEQLVENKKNNRLHEKILVRSISIELKFYFFFNKNKL